MAEKRIIEVDDFEHRVMMKALADQRSDCLEEDKPTDDLSKVLLKVIDLNNSFFSHQRASLG